MQLSFAFDVQTKQVKPEPFLKWAGGKGQLLIQFERFIPTKFNRYFEPFLGGGAFFFHLQPTLAVLNDINPNLAAAYRHIKERPDDLLEILTLVRRKYHALSANAQEQEYYALRARYNELPSDALEKAALLIVLNKTGYNGLYRENRKGGFNVPFGRYDNPAIFDEGNIRAVSAALQSAEILNCNFAQAVATVAPDDFVYFDPPYLPLSKTASFTAYSAADFDESQQIRLAQVARQLAERGAHVMLSNSDTAFIRDIYRDLYLHEVKATRAINSNPNARGKITELVITSYDVKSA